MESYDLYLKRKTKELHETSEKQRHALTYHYPDVTELEKWRYVWIRVFTKNNVPS